MKKQKQTKSHPIHDLWPLTRAKLRAGKKYYGAYPAGFLERARIVLAAHFETPILHVCGGMAKYYAFPRGFGPFDKTLDLDPETEPDFLQDARERWPLCDCWLKECANILQAALWRAVLIDPPYSEFDAGKYRVGSKVLPTPTELLRRAVEVTAIGARIGILHYIWARPVAGLRQIGIYSVLTGCGNRARCFTVFERIAVEC